MKYRLKKETKPTLPTFGKYKAVAVHYHTVESRQLIKEVAQRMGTHTSNVLAVMTRLRAKRLTISRILKPKSTSVVSASISSLKATKATKNSTKASPSRKTSFTQRNNNKICLKVWSFRLFSLSLR